MTKEVSMNLMRFDPYREFPSLEERLHRAFGVAEMPTATHRLLDESA